MNEPGELTFTVPPTCAYYSNLKSAGIRICVAVFRDGSFLWSGHPLTIDEDLYGSLTYSCEGVLGWLSDVIAPVFNRSGITIWGMFVSIFTSPYSYGTRCTDGNSVASCYRRFSEVSMWSSIAVEGFSEASSTDTITRYTEKNLTAMEIFKTRFYDYFGGYLEVGLMEESVDVSVSTYGIWTLEYKNQDASNVMSLSVGENIQSLTRTTDYTDFCTAYAPVDSNENSILSAYTMHGEYSDYETEGTVDFTYYGAEIVKPYLSPLLVNMDLAGKYGVIAQTLDVTSLSDSGDSNDPPEKDDFDTEELWQAAYDEWVGARVSETYARLATLAEPESTIEVEATDTTLVTGNYLHVGDKISYTDAENNEYADMVIEELEIDLDDPTSNKITLNGTLKALSKKVK